MIAQYKIQHDVCLDYNAGERIVSFPFIYSSIPATSAYDVFIRQLIHYSGVCVSSWDFDDIVADNQWFLWKIKSSRCFAILLDTCLWVDIWYASDKWMIGYWCQTDAWLNIGYVRDWFILEHWICQQLVYDWILDMSKSNVWNDIAYFTEKCLWLGIVYVGVYQRTIQSKI